MYDKVIEFDSLYMGLEALAKDDLSFIERIEIEGNELYRRYEGLRQFVKSDKFNTLDETMRDLMNKQYKVMGEYLEILNKRYDILLAKEKKNEKNKL